MFAISNNLLCPCLVHRVVFCTGSHSLLLWIPSRPVVPICRCSQFERDPRTAEKGIPIHNWISVFPYCYSVNLLLDKKWFDTKGRDDPRDTHMGRQTLAL